MSTDAAQQKHNLLCHNAVSDNMHFAFPLCMNVQCVSVDKKAHATGTKVEAISLLHGFKDSSQHIIEASYTTTRN
jgi:hypothetical protein